MEDVNILIVAVFLFVSLQMLLGANRVCPLDRRLSALLGAAICKATAPNVSTTYVDFRVLLILASIMCLNFVVIQQPIVAKALRVMQGTIRVKLHCTGQATSWSLWVVAALSFLAAPLVTNDGLVLLIVDPLLDSFNSEDDEKDEKSAHHRETDKLHFALVTACSANIGSSLTLVGNPQNMIVGTRAGPALSSSRFFIVLLLPALFSFILTTWYLDRRRRSRHTQLVLVPPTVPGGASIESAEVETEDIVTSTGPGTPSHSVFESFLVLPAVAALLIIELTGAVQLDLLFSLGATFLVATVLLLSYLSPYWLTRSGGSGIMRTLAVEKGIEALFSSLDYNLLIIFGASFVVSGTLLDTQIPSVVWAKLVGTDPLSSPEGVVSLMAVIVFGSQLLGNVPVMYMVASLLAKSTNSPNTLRSTWLLVAFTSTMAGNVLLSGSACGVIVAEKSARHETQSLRVTARDHFAACCGITILCISVGGYLLIAVDSLFGDIAI